MTASLSTEQLLQLSPDKLLETHTVNEAEAVAQQLAKEVDRKRKELRVMVGERYRDLISRYYTEHEALLQLCHPVSGRHEAVM